MACGDLPEGGAAGDFRRLADEAVLEPFCPAFVAAAGEPSLGNDPLPTRRG
jgi:hypothetical protein